MRSIGIKALGLVAAAAIHSHAIFGLGGHWAPAPGLTVKSETKNVGTTGISLVRGEVSGLQGFGMKLWIDALPFIDIEGTTNIQFGFYDLSVSGGGDTVEVVAPLDVPMVDDKPGFARITSDISVLYPFLKLPPAISLVKFYAGGGLTHVLSTEVLSEELARKAVAKAGATTPEAVADALTDILKDEGFTNGVGFHLMAGAQVKPPIIPLAVYANMKYHFIGSQPDAVDENSLTFELGGALAF